MLLLLLLRHSFSSAAFFFLLWMTASWLILFFFLLGIIRLLCAALLGVRGPLVLQVRLLSANSRLYCSLLFSRISLMYLILVIALSLLLWLCLIHPFGHVLSKRFCYFHYLCYTHVNPMHAFILCSVACSGLQTLSNSISLLLCSFVACNSCQFGMLFWCALFFMWLGSQFTVTEVCCYL